MEGGLGANWAFTWNQRAHMPNKLSFDHEEALAKENLLDMDINVTLEIHKMPVKTVDANFSLLTSAIPREFDTESCRKVVKFWYASPFRHQSRLGTMAYQLWVAARGWSSRFAMLQISSGVSRLRAFADISSCEISSRQVCDHVGTCNLLWWLSPFTHRHKGGKAYCKEAMCSAWSAWHACSRLLWCALERNMEDCLERIRLGLPLLFWTEGSD